jgi:hypothetical protein
MDTRRKIVPPESAPAGATVVTAYFDVLQSEDTRDLAVLPRPVIALILPLEDALLPQSARAELAAGLRMIDYVVLAGDGAADAQVARLRPAQVVRLEAAQARRSRELKEHVRNRQTR